MTTITRSETLAEFLERKRDPNWKPAPLRRPTSLPRLSDQAFEKLYREHMAEWGQPVDEHADIFATLPTRGGTPFRQGNREDGPRLYPVAETDNNRFAVVKHRRGKYDVYHRPSGLYVPTQGTDTETGKRFAKGTALDGDGWRLKGDAERFMRALDEADVLDDDPNGISRRPDVLTALRAFVASYEPRS